MLGLARPDPLLAPPSRSLLLPRHATPHTRPTHSPAYPLAPCGAGLRRALAQLPALTELRCSNDDDLNDDDITAFVARMPQARKLGA